MLNQFNSYFALGFAVMNHLSPTAAEIIKDPIIGKKIMMRKYFALPF
jgi:hypothetical protein